MDIFKQLSPNDADIGSNFAMLTSAIEANGLTVVDLLSSVHFSSSTNLPQLSKKLGRSIREVEEFLNILKKECTEASTQCSLKERFGKEQTGDKCHFIPTGLEALDRQLNGGIPLGEITEIFGASGCGKSQLLLQLCIYTQLVGDPQNNQCIYVSTESPLETRRLHDMIDHYNAKSDKKVLMDNISCIYCQDIENQDHTLFTQLPVKLSQEKGKVRAIIIDSISHHLRLEEAITNTMYITDHIKAQEEALTDSKEYAEIKTKLDQQFKAFFKSTPKYQNRIAKTQYLMLLHRHLLSIAKDNNIAIITANQVSDYPENITDLSIYEDADDSLNLEYQLGQYSGWDNRSIFKHQQLFLQNQDIISSKESDLAYYELLRSIDQINNLNKRQKMSLPLNETEIDPRYNKHNNASVIDDQYSNQEDLIDKLHRLENCETKKIVPTLGYHWGKNMVSRLMLMKTYRPLLKDKATLADTHQPVDPESRLTYDSLCEGFNLPTQTEGSIKRKADNNSSPENNQKNNTIYGVESLIDGWGVERYVKVVASPYDLVSLNGMFNENRKIPFQITTNGITEI